VLPMSEQFSWDDSVKGAVASAFFAGYTVSRHLALLSAPFRRCESIYGSWRLGICCGESVARKGGRLHC
jgi:hypothetical protein